MSFELKTHTAIINYNIIIAARKLKYCLHDILIIITIVTAWVYTNVIIHHLMDFVLINHRGYLFTSEQKLINIEINTPQNYLQNERK